MKEITKTYVVYNYDELNKEGKKKALEEACRILTEIRDEHLEEDLFEEAYNKYNLNPDFLFYSLSYSQGDGLCFILKNVLSYTRLKDSLYGTGSLDRLNVFEKAISELDKERQGVVLEYLNSDYNISIKKISWHYEHCRTCDFEWEYYKNDNASKEDQVNKVIEELCSHTGLLRKVYDEACDHLEKLGYEIGYPSEEDTEEFIEENEYVFLEDGSIFSE